MNRKAALNWLMIISFLFLVAIALLSLLPPILPFSVSIDDPFSVIMAVVTGLSGIYLSIKSAQVDELELVRDRRMILRCKQKMCGVLDKWVLNDADYGLATGRQGLIILSKKLDSIEDSCEALYPPLIELNDYLKIEIFDPVSDLDSKNIYEPIYERVGTVQRNLRREIDSELKRHGSHLKRPSYP